MREQLIAEVRRRGVIRRDEALAVVAEHVLDDALRVGAVVRVFPGVYAMPGGAGDIEIRRHGALAHRRGGALSHTDGLAVWDLPTHLDGAVHLTVPETDPA